MPVHLYRSDTMGHSFLMLDFSWSGETHTDPSPCPQGWAVKRQRHWARPREAPRSSEIDGLAGKAAATAAWVITPIQPTSPLLSHVPECKGHTKWFNVHAKAPSGKSTRKASGTRAWFNVFYNDFGLNFCIPTVGILTPKMHVSKQEQTG